MTRRLHKPTVDATKSILPIPKGGHASNTAGVGSNNLGVVTNFQKNIAQGAIAVDAETKASVSYLPNSLDAQAVQLTGSLTAYLNKKEVYTIVNYDSFKKYTVTVTAGTIVQTGRNLTFTPPATIGVVVMTVNGCQYSIDVLNAGPKKPVIQSPLNNAVGAPIAFTVIADAFVPYGGMFNHQSSDWQFATDISFTNIIKASMADTVNLIQYSITGLSILTKYYLRVRYKGDNGAYSNWSDTVTITTGNQYVFNVTISANVNNYSLSAAALAAGWDGSLPLNSVITIPAGVQIGSADTVTAAFDVGTVSVGSVLSLINNGVIVGKGGTGGSARASGATAGTAGGPAFKTRTPISITNNGTIGGGGGGGGAGEGGGYTVADGKTGGTVNYYAGGGGGGSGAGFTASPGGTGDTTITTGYKYRYATSGGQGTATVGGAGGSSSYGSNGPNDYMSGGSGGSGGNLGAPGSAGNPRGYGAEAGFYPTPFSWYAATAPGAAGAAVDGNSYVTWVNTGTRLGALIN